MNLLKDFIRYAFLSRESNEKDEVIDIGELSVKGEKGDTAIIETTRSTIIIQINRSLLFISLISFIIIVYFAIFKNEKDIPVIIQNTFSLTLGYFSSALLTYVEKGKKR